MAQELVHPCQAFHGTPSIPGDKSISHRGLIFGAMASGTTEVIDILESGDVQSTAQCLERLGIKIWKEGKSTFVKSEGIQSFREAQQILDCGNSGTTMRLLMGVLAGLPFKTQMTGDSSLLKRPMKRVADPLTQMGAQFDLKESNFAPLWVKGGQLHGISYSLKVASAQIKSAIMLAALQAKGETRISGEIHSRDHSERLLTQFGAQLSSSPTEIIIPGQQSLKASKLQVPGDPSTAAFWMAAAALIPGSDLFLRNISLNPTRTGFIKVLERMGVDVQITQSIEGPEPVGDIRVRHKDLKAFQIESHEVPGLIDEIPVLAILASQAFGQSEVEGAEELRVKESDRLEAVASNLRKLGVNITLKHDGFVIQGPQKINGNVSIETFHDHRIAMAFSVAALVSDSPLIILDAECASISYPKFFQDLRELTQNA